jgi:uncharacterized RDD family membrane protein YckC
MGFASAVFFIPMMIKQFANAFMSDHDPKEFMFPSGPLFYMALIGPALYYCKDCINGRSPGKRITKLQVVDNKIGAVASPLQCLVRGLFIIIWPIEVIVTLTNPARRIGDLVAGTKVIDYDPALEQPKIDIVKLIIPFAISYGFIALIMLGVQSLTHRFAGFVIRQF